MLINNNISFQSRNSTIRKADDIARRVTVKYPIVSVTKYISMPSHINFVDSLKKLDKGLLKSRYEIMYLLESDCAPAVKIKQMLNLYKKHKRGNCGEFADIAATMAKAAGINNISVAELRTKTGENLDHWFVLVEDGEKPYIIDSWLGFADYVPNALNKYATVYKKYFSDSVHFSPSQLTTKQCLYSPIISTLKDFMPKEWQEFIKKLRNDKCI